MDKPNGPSMSYQEEPLFEGVQARVIVSGPCGTATQHPEVCTGAVLDLWVLELPKYISGTAEDGFNKLVLTLNQWLPHQSPYPGATHFLTIQELWGNDLDDETGWSDPVAEMAFATEDPTLAAQVVRMWLEALVSGAWMLGEEWEFGEDGDQLETQVEELVTVVRHNNFEPRPNQALEGET